jgi:acyl-CoA synthetase (AMP-forming)/AMP-acid ligase II
MTRPRRSERTSKEPERRSERTSKEPERRDYDPGTSLWHLIERRAAATPDLVLAVDELGRRITFGEYRERVLETAAGFASRGMQPGDVVSWILPTWIEATIVTGALDRLGVTQNPMLGIYREREVGFIARQLQTDWFVVTREWRGFDYETMVRAFCDDIVTVERGAPLPSGDPSTLPPPADPDRIAWIMYTSGTTADPKGAMHRHSSVAAMTRSMCRRLAVTPDDRSALAFPFAHLGGINWLMAALMSGCRLILIESFTDPDAIPTLRREGVTLAGVTTAFHLAYLAAQRAQPDVPLFPHVRAYPGGAAPKPPQLHYDLVQEVGGVGIVAGWGLTEGAMLGMCAVWDPPEKLAHTEGRASDGMEIVAIGDDGSVLPPGVDGELRVRGPHMFVGYVDPDLMKDAFDERGFFRTGDLGHLDADGYVVITGRLKDVIIRKGENISAKEVEDLVYEHVKVADVAVIGVPDDASGERVCAVVACEPGAEPLTMDELRHHLRDKGLITRKWPEQLELVDSLPRNAAGKVLKHELRVRYADP